ncbi:MAG: acyltransferase [Bacteroidales bacterium]|nr:acyltransferase [Bacteroidales bacterium]
MKGSRNQYFDLLRGVAIVMVIGIHTFSYSNGNFQSTMGCINVLIRQILNCAVPLFLAISGFFLANKDLSDKEKRLTFWKHQIPKVYIPTLIWGVPWLCLAIYDGKSTILSILLWVVCGLSIFYYIALIIQYYMLLPIIQRVTNPIRLKWGMIISFLISIVSIVLVTWIRALQGKTLPLIIYAGPFPVWLMFFVLGVTLAKSKRDYKLLWGLLAAVASLLLQFFEAHYLESIGASGMGIKISSFLFSASIIVVLFSKKLECSFNSANLLNKLMVWIGSLSFGMYLTHMLVYWILKQWCFFDGWYMRWIVVLLLDVVFVVALKSILPKRFIKLLGL